MITLKRGAVPRVLREHGEAWTARYVEQPAPRKRPSSSKYAHAEIVQALASMSHWKCFYCESAVKDRSEVDHHEELATAPARAFDWTNLYLACFECNRKKSGSPHGCIDPCDAAALPIRELAFDDELIRPRDASVAGRNTIGRYKLDRPSLDYARSRALTRFYRLLAGVERACADRGGGPISATELEMLCAFAEPEAEFSLMFRELVERVRQRSSGSSETLT